MTEKGNELWRDLKEEVLKALDLLEEVTDERVLEVIDQVLKTSGHRHKISLDMRCTLRLELFYSIRKLDVLERLLEELKAKAEARRKEADEAIREAFYINEKLRREAKKRLKEEEKGGEA